jgi:hypothetical protein
LHKVKNKVKMMKNDEFYNEILEYQKYMSLYEYQLKNQSKLNSQESSVEQGSDELKFYVDRFNSVM